MNRQSVLLAFAAIALATTASCAQAGAAPAANGGLPPGLVRQGNVIMMRPIGTSDETESGPLVFAGDRRLGNGRFLGAEDRDIFGRAADAAARGDWVNARAAAAELREPIARRLIEWAYLLDRGSGASFDEIADFLKNYPDWPAHDALIARAEAAMPPTMDPRAIIGWFGDRAPLTGIGNVRLGEAWIAAGSPERGRALIRDAWAEKSFEPEQEYYVEAQHADALTPEAERARLDRLLARDDDMAARREIPRVDAEMQRIASVRLDLRADPLRGESEADALPVPLRDDPGLLFDEARALRQRNEILAVPPLIVRASAGDLVRLDPTRWWAELNADARTALEQHYDSEAYALCADAVLPRDSEQYAEAQFLAGWIALRRLGEPAVALTHFQNLYAAVSRPISRARAHYWLGRAHEAAGDMASAAQEYRAAGHDSATFYGQLAMARLTAAPVLRLTSSSVDTNSARAAFERDDLTTAIRILAEFGSAGLVREFAVRDAQLHPDPARLKLLAEDVARRGYPDAAVRVAKNASYGGTLLFHYSHPVIAVPRYAGPGLAPENALVLAVIRQETEFDPGSVSRAGARGIMQVMPDSAPTLARLSGLPYEFAALTGDTNYNMELGMTELSRQLSEWNGSYVLAAAAYNAGPGNVRKWIAFFGDPRDAHVDPVDWIEEIPFDETRNYVERVLENVEVYRDRLAGRDEPLQIMTDLYRPDAPQVSPLRYAPTAPEAAATAAPLPTPLARPVMSSDPPAPTATPRPKPDR
ncbi:MAG: transglycosylase SLT domain-containing protein [Rhizomicrobium sp.]